MEYYEFRDQFEFSKIFDEVVNIAYENNGKEIAESLINQKYIDKAFYYGHEEIK